MKKLILFAAASLIAGQASAYAQSRDYSSEHVTTKHRRMMSAQARWLGPDGGAPYGYRVLPVAVGVPPYGYAYEPYGYGPPPHGFGDGVEAEGRTNGGG